ncbi:MAG TPA: glycosyltransferase family 1 protein [Candidatus Saccharimonadales bacterium]|nr:glycosyltransferase family 1 protein [Candidatus Saccharimonadales bacterium]
MARTKLFVEGIPLVADRVSGVGHALAGIVAALATNKAFQEQFEIVIVGPRKRLHLLDRWPGLASCGRKGIPLKLRVMNRLSRYHLLPPMDLLLGPGFYLFGNYNNWPLTKRSKSFTYMYDVSFRIYPEFTEPSNLSMLRRNIPYFIANTDYVLTSSQNSRHELLKYFDVQPDKIKIVPIGVEREIYRPYSSKEIAQVKKKYEIDKQYFLFVSNIEPRKNVERLIAAFRQLPKDYALVLVGGNGWLNEPIFAAIEEARKAGATIIKPASYVSDEEVGTLMSGALALVHPALHEGFGMPPLEAMAAETVVVSADISALHEVVGDAGIYCDPLDVDAIADAMQKASSLSAKERTALIKKGILQVAKFSWTASGEKLGQFLAQQRK